MDLVYDIAKEVILHAQEEGGWHCERLGNLARWLAVATAPCRLTLNGGKFSAGHDATSVNRSQPCLQNPCAIAGQPNVNKSSGGDRVQSALRDPVHPCLMFYRARRTRCLLVRRLPLQKRRMLRCEFKMASMASAGARREEGGVMTPGLAAAKDQL